VSVCCPDCLSELHVLDDHLACPHCKREFPVDAGIPILSKNPSAYYKFAGIERHEFREFLGEIDRDGFQTAVRRFLKEFNAEHAEAFYKNTFSRERAAWKFALSLPDKAKVLDLGAGAGVVSMALAPHCASVLACDITWERLSFLKRWAAYEAVNNIAFVCGGDTERIPFGTDQCDVVVLNGVLEWVPAGKSGNPRQCQLEFLREVRRILKPSGQLYIGIENRIGYPYFFGKKEDHTGIRFLSLLPRPIAHAVHRLRRQSGFRTYTYTTRALTNLLNSTGFADVLTYSPFPDYRHFDQFVPLDGRTCVTPPVRRRRISSLAHRVACHPTILRHISPSLSVVAGNADGRALLYDIGDLLQLDLGSATIDALTVSQTGMVTWRARHRDGTPTIIRLPVSPGGRLRCEDNYGALEAIHSHPDIDEAVRGRVPLPMGRGEVKGQFATAESMLPGRRLGVTEEETISKAWPHLVDVIENVGQVEMPQSGENSPDIPTSIERWVTAIQHNLPSTEEGHRQRDVVRSTADWLLESAPSPQFAHGNCTVDNILVDQHARLSGLYDWDLSRWGMFPLIDLLEFGIAARHKGLRDVDSFLRPVIPECHSTIERLAGLKGLPSNYVQILEMAFLLRLAGLKGLPRFVRPEHFRAIQRITNLLGRHMRRCGIGNIP
jgi:SAM-dependent methyltransferase/aminoglycoside phosphotransferase (APT) family kinase protein